MHHARLALQPDSSSLSLTSSILTLVSKVSGHLSEDGRSILQMKAADSEGCCMGP